LTKTVLLFEYWTFNTSGCLQSNSWRTVSFSGRISHVGVD